MNSLSKLFALCLLAVGAFSCGGKEVATANYEVIPLPQSITLQEGKHFVLSDTTKIIYPADNVRLKQTASFLSDYVFLSTGIKMETSEAGSKEQSNAIVLATGYEGEGAESYQLKVSNMQVLINGTSEAGTFYGVQTLRKSLPVAQLSRVDLPLVEINDAPRFQYRGVMLDVSRHMFPVTFIKKYIDLLALHNINRFHWHLSDDQGWRIEIKKYPKLTEVGSIRKETVIGRNSEKYDGKQYGGFYTQQEVRAIVAYAADRFITVVPEIDLPGHMLAALAAYPELGCTGGPYEVATKWGVYDDVLCVGNEQTFTFLDDVFTEVLSMFPSKYIHVGGDECPKVRWKTCPKCQARIKAEGIKADKRHSAEDRLQSYCIARMEKFLNSKGRQIIGWDEILEGGLAPNATVMSWRGMDGGIQAAKERHNVIMTPGTHLYFDHYQSLDTKDEPLAIGGFSDVSNVYHFEPVPAELTADEQKYVIGTQANLWTEYIATSKQAEYMLVPRIAALSEVQWTQAERKDYNGFLQRLYNMTKLYDKMEVNYARHLFDVQASTEVNPEEGTLAIAFSTLDNSPIYYTLDGSEPGAKSTLYKHPVEIKGKTEIKAVVVRGDSSKSKVYSDAFVFNKATLKPITLAGEPQRRYAFKGAITLVDGKEGGSNYQTGEWIGFNENDLNATIDLKEPTEVSSVTIGTYVNTGDWIFGATALSVAISDKGTDFKEVFYQSYPVCEKGYKTGIYKLEAKFEKQAARYIRVKAEVTKKLPDWHSGKGKSSYLFVDEIEVN